LGSRQRKVERERRLAKLGEGPRETIALVLIEEREALAELVKNLIRSGAAGDMRAAQTLVRYLDQGLGRVEEHKAQQPGDDDLASIPREERAQMIAELRRQIAERDEEGRPIRRVGLRNDSPSGQRVRQVSDLPPQELAVTYRLKGSRGRE
jgi:hypothetical protein